MKEQSSKVPRRTFFKIGGAGLAALASGSMRLGWAQNALQLASHATDSEANSSFRNRPANPVVLKSEELEVVLDRKDGLPYEYHLLRAKTQLRGEDYGKQISATICDLGQWKFSPITLTTVSAETTANQADFHFQASQEGKPAVNFTIRYHLQGSTLTVTLEDVQEHEGFELIDVSLPRLATVREEDSGAWLAHGENGGDVAKLSEAKAASLPPNRFWGKVLATLPVVMVGTDKAICVQEVTAFMDGTALEVTGTDGHRRASLGTIQTYRVNGSSCYDLNLDEAGGNPRNCGTNKTPNLLIGQKSSCRLDFISDVDGDGTVDWLDG